MKIKAWIAVVLCILLVGCGKKDVRLAHRNPVDSAAEVADFTKAALLNVQMGESYLAQGQISRAKKKFIHALELRPKLPEAHSSIAFFYETVGEISEAEHHHKQAISFGKGKGRFYNNYGTYLCRQGQQKAADRAFRKAIEDKSYINTAEVYENAGFCALQGADVDKAYGYLHKAVRLDPSRSNAILELANLEIQRKNVPVAAELLSRFKKMNDVTAKSLLLTIKLNRLVKNADEEANAVLKLKSLFPYSNEYKTYLELSSNERK